MPTSSKCRFDPQQMSVWTTQTGLHLWSDAEREDTYIFAHPFLQEQKGKLLQDGWVVGNRDSEKDILFHAYKLYGEQKAHDNSGFHRAEIILPKAFASFLDPSQADTWRSVFENAGTFGVQHNEQTDDVYTDLHLCISSGALLNIFCLLQVLAPGMLIEYQSSDTSTVASRALPRPMWIEKDLPDVVASRILGGIPALISAANDEKKAFLEGQSSCEVVIEAADHGGLPSTTAVKASPEWEYSSDEDYYSYDNSPVGDFAACDRECGYCGDCPY